MNTQLGALTQFRKSRDLTRPWKFGEGSAPVLLLGDEGSGKADILLEIADQAIALGKSVLYFTTKADVKCAANLCGSADKHGVVSKFYVNSYLIDHGGTDLLKMATRPEWSDVLLRSGIVCTLFGPLSRFDDATRGEFRKMVNDSIQAIADHDSAMGVVLLIDDIGHLGSHLLTTLKAVASDEVEVIVGCSYWSFTRREVEFPSSEIRPVLLRATAPALDDIRYLTHDIVDVEELRSLPHGAGFELDMRSESARPVCFSVTPPHSIREVRYANEGMR